MPRMTEALGTRAVQGSLCPPQPLRNVGHASQWCLCSVLALRAGPWDTEANKGWGRP